MLGHLEKFSQPGAVSGVESPGLPGGGACPKGRASLNTETSTLTPKVGLRLADLCWGSWAQRRTKGRLIRASLRTAPVGQMLGHACRGKQRDLTSPLRQPPPCSAGGDQSGVSLCLVCFAVGGLPEGLQNTPRLCHVSLQRQLGFVRGHG